MSKVFIEETTLTNIGAAIREKTGKSDLIAPGDMPAEIRGIVSGGGGGGDIDFPEEISFSQATNGCAAWQWILEDMPPTTINIYSGSTGVFANCDRVEDLSNFTCISNIQQVYQSLFQSCNNLKVLPVMRSSNTNLNNFNQCFNGCYQLREIPEDYFCCKDANGVIISDPALASAVLKQNAFLDCYSLRHFPKWHTQPQTSTATNGRINYTYQNCYAADELLDVLVYTANITSNFYYSGSFNNLSRVNRIKFLTDTNGNPYTTSHKAQAIDLSIYIGYAANAGDILNYNSGITADKQVTDNASYQALKNDKDWFTTDINYSRYNHDSAVETIQTLPDASGGSNNSIKFKGDSGALTDGGAINTMTEAEIAIATAKGWSISFV